MAPPVASSSPVRRRALLALLVATLASGAVAQSPPEPERLFAAVEASLSELPRDRFDLQAAVAEAIATAPSGTDEMLAIFTWVRDQTGLVPYRGMLKGPAGVLMDRAGNSLDRALLLRDMLLAAGEQAVLATATLDESALAKVAAALRNAPASGPTGPGSAQLAARLAEEFGADASAVQTRLDQAEQARRALLETLHERTQTQAAALTELLAGARESTLDGTALLSDHWWVQVQRDGDWLDLDPTLPGATPGEVVVAATARFGPSSLGQLAAVEGSCRDLTCGERLHSVVIRAISESWDGSALSETELLSVELLPAELLGQSIAFAAMAEDWPQSLDLFGTADSVAALREALLATTTWKPALFVGSASHQGLSVNDDGTTAAPASSGGVGGFGGGLGGMFGGGIGGGGGAREGEFTALWLEFEVRVPGRPVEVVRRALFDLVGPAARAAGGAGVAFDETARLARAAALTGDTQVALFGAHLHPAAVSAAAANRLLASRQEWTELYYLGASADPAFLLERQNEMAALVSPLETYSLLLSDAAATPGGALGGGFQSGVSVVAFHRGLDLGLQPYSSFDLVLSQTGSLHGDDSLPAGVAAGVAAGNLEALLQRAREPLTGAGAAPNSVAEAFASDLSANRPWRLATNAAELDANSPALAADLRQRALDELAAGKLVVAPAGGDVAVGFWSFDTSSGEVLAIGDRGWGQALTEYDVITNIVLQLRTVLNQYASMAQCLGIALTMPLRGETGVTEELAECVFNLVCGQLNTAINTLMVTETNWTNVILSATIDALWGGAPEAGFGGFCGGLWSQISSG